VESFEVGDRLIELHQNPAGTHVVPRFAMIWCFFKNQGITAQEDFYCMRNCLPFGVGSGWIISMQKTQLMPCKRAYWETLMLFGSLMHVPFHLPLLFPSSSDNNIETKGSTVVFTNVLLQMIMTNWSVEKRWCTLHIDAFYEFIKKVSVSRLG
jgi:hypothetical protein